MTIYFFRNLHPTGTTVSLHSTFFASHSCSYIVSAAMKLFLRCLVLVFSFSCFSKRRTFCQNFSQKPNQCIPKETTNFEETTIPNKINLPKGLTFKEVQQGERISKVFIGQKIVLYKVNQTWLGLWIPFDKKGWIEIVKNIPGRKWRRTGVRRVRQ